MQQLLNRRRKASIMMKPLPTLPQKVEEGDVGIAGLLPYFSPSLPLSLPGHTLGIRLLPHCNVLHR